MNIKCFKPIRVEGRLSSLQQIAKKCGYRLDSEYTENAGYTQNPELIHTTQKWKDNKDRIAEIFIVDHPTGRSCSLSMVDEVDL